MDNVKPFRPKSSPADAIVDDRLLAVAFDIAKSAVSKEPEQTARVWAHLERSLSINIPEWFQLPDDGKEVLIASVFYFVGVRINEVIPIVRELIAKHVASCPRHVDEQHKIQIEFGADGSLNPS